MTKGIPEDLRLLYQNSIDNLEFAKRQQWWVTAQTLVLLAALLGGYNLLEHKIWWELVFVIVFIVLVSAWSIYIIFDYWAWREGERKRMEWIRNQYASLEFKLSWKKKQEYRDENFWLDRLQKKYPKLQKKKLLFDATFMLQAIVFSAGTAIIYLIVSEQYFRVQILTCWT